jgi:phosphodiesterase/alkaline phosphatase D-like protein
MPGRIGTGLTRRGLLKAGTASTAFAAVTTIGKPYLSRAADRPLITHGVQSGDVSVDSGMVWARADRPARMLVEVATTDSFKSIRSGVFVDALPESDFTAKVLIEGLPAAHSISGSREPNDRRRADDWAVPHGAERPPLDLVHLVGRHRGTRLGHRRGPRRHAHLRHDAAQPPRFLHP